MASLQGINRELMVMDINSRFWSKVDKSVGDDGCWNWTAYKCEWGYGIFGLSGRRLVKAHRYAFGLDRIPGGFCVLHKCDNPACVNPAHLFLGTNKDNIADKVSKGRQAKGASIKQKVGEKNINAKLNSKQVLEIRKMFSCGEKTKTELGRMFGVTMPSIYAIVKNKTWRHLEN